MLHMHNMVNGESIKVQTRNYFNISNGLKRSVLGLAKHYYFVTIAYYYNCSYH